MRSLFALLVAATAMTPAAAWAQGGAVIAPGTRVQIAESGTGGRGVLRGTVVAKSADTLALRLDAGGETVSIAWARVSRLELSRGVTRRTLAGLGYGLLGGVGAGALVGVLACKAERNCRSSNNEMNSPQFYAVVLGVLGGGVGSVIGTVIGASTRSERWETVPSRHWSLSARPDTHGGFALSLSARF